MFAKKTQHCLFVEEEHYDWAPERSLASKRGLFVMGCFLLGVVVALTLLS